jgi:pilus assembly protein CpaF
MAGEVEAGMSLLRRVEQAQRAHDAAAREATGQPVAPEAAGRTTPGGPGSDQPSEIVRRMPSAPGPRSAAREALLQEIRTRAGDLIVADFRALADVADPGQVRTKIAGMVDRIILEGSYSVTRDERGALVEEIVHELTGLGPIEPYLMDDTITEVMVNGPKQVYIERAGKLVRVDATFLNDEHVKRIIDRIIAPLGRHIDETSPRVDARLADGSRVNAIIEPLSLIGPVITIRKFSARPYTVDDLIRFGTATAEMFEFIRTCVQARLNIFVSGGTGSGKTTTLNVLSSCIPEEQRIVTIEDAAELQLNQTHVVTLEARPSNLEGEGEITIRDLLRNALHMRPDRIIVGECRGGEALDMIQAMTTGQEGSLSTGHANTTRDMLRRLETMILMTGYELPLRAIREQIASAVDVIIHTARLKDGSRKIVNITEVYGIEDDEIQTQDIFAFQQTEFRDGKVIGELKPTGIRPTFMDVFKAHGVEMPPGEFGIPPADPKNPGPPGKGRWGAGAGLGLAASKPKVGKGRATVAGGMAYVTAVGPLDPASGMVVNGGIKEHARQVMTNLKTLLESVGSSLEKVVWVSWSLREPSEFDDFNEEFLRWFSGDAPGGQGTLLPLSHRRAGFRVSIAVIAEA